MRKIEPVRGCLSAEDLEGVENIRIEVTKVTCTTRRPILVTEGEVINRYAKRRGLMEPEPALQLRVTHNAHYDPRTKGFIPKDLSKRRKKKDTYLYANIVGAWALAPGESGGSG